MIFAAEYAENSHALLTETEANWLLVETNEIGKIKLVYLDSKNTVQSTPLWLTSKGWQVIDNKQAPENLPQIHPRITGDTVLNNKTNLGDIIMSHLSLLYKEKQTEWNSINSIRLLPVKSEVTTTEVYQLYCNSIISKTESTTAAKFTYNPDYWPYKVALANCIWDTRLYPTVEINKLYSISTTSTDVVKIRNELKKLMDNKTLILDNSLLMHPYYKEFCEAFNYRVNKIEQAFANETIDKNSEIIKKYNATMQSKKNTSGPLKKEKKEVTTVQTPCHYANITNCQGDRLTQEDYASVVAGINLHDSWQERIPELLVYIIQTLAAKLYKEKFSVTSELAVGSTLSLVFIKKAKDIINVYSACLGDSPIILVKTTHIKDKLPKTTAEYLYAPHSADLEIASPEEYNRVIQEKGAIEFINHPGIMPHYRLNGVLMVTRALGDRSAGYGMGIGDIPDVAVCSLPMSDTETNLIIIGSDGLNDHLSLTQIAEICQKTSFNDLSKACCEAAYANVPEKKAADNIIAAVSKCQDDTFMFVLDGHGPKNGHIIAENGNLLLPSIIKDIAENPAPQVIQNLSAKNTLVETLDPHYSFSSDEDSSEEERPTQQDHSSQEERSTPKKRKLNPSIQEFGLSHKKLKNKDSDSDTETDTEAPDITPTTHPSNQYTIRNTR